LGQGGGSPGKKEAGGVREAEAEGLGSRIPGWQEAGEI